MDVSSDDLAILPEIPILEYTVIDGPLVNTSVDDAKDVVWTEWRSKRENAAVSDDEDYESKRDSTHEDSDDDLEGLVEPEDDEDSEADSQSVDDRIEAEWEKEWAEMGVLGFSMLTSFPL